MDTATGEEIWSEIQSECSDKALDKKWVSVESLKKRLLKEYGNAVNCGATTQLFIKGLIIELNKEVN